MAKRKQKMNKKEISGSYQYNMSKKMAMEILKKRKNKEDVQSFLCEYVNSTFGLLRPVTKVIYND